MNNCWYLKSPEKSEQPYLLEAILLIVLQRHNDFHASTFTGSSLPRKEMGERKGFSFINKIPIREILHDYMERSRSSYTTAHLLEILWDPAPSTALPFLHGNLERELWIVCSLYCYEEDLKRTGICFLSLFYLLKETTALRFIQTKIELTEMIVIWQKIERRDDVMWYFQKLDLTKNKKKTEKRYRRQFRKYAIYIRVIFHT